MSGTRETGDHQAANVNYGTQIFNGAVYFVQQAPGQTISPTTTRVFLSYARADDDPDYDDPQKSFMRRLYNTLTAEGFAVWWDRESLPSRGETFTAEIETAIRACDRFVLVVGPAAVTTSKYVPKEWECALSHCKPITPILREGDFNLVPTTLEQINAIDCRPSREESAAMADLVKRLHEDAPLGEQIGVKALPKEYILREAPYYSARDALLTDAINPTIISAPSSAVALYGLGGIGKSTLAAALAHDCKIRRHFRDGVLWVEVGQKPTIPALQAIIGTHFGDSRENYQDESSGTFNLSRVLKDKAALILLDDVWDHQVVDRFPINGSACRLLITTRSGSLAGRVDGADIRLNLLSEDEGASLIAGIVGGSSDNGSYRTITSRLGGHTLAVSLAAKQIAEGYASDAEDMLRLIDKRKDGADPFKDLVLEETDKDRNLALSLSLSYEALPSDDLRRRFRQTGIFALESTFDRAALAAIWGDEDEDDARRPLQMLVGLGLLDTEGDGRYSQHGLLHAYARALLSQHDEADVTFGRYADYVIEMAAQFKELPLERWWELDALLPHVHHVGDHLVQRYSTTPTPDDALTRRMGDFSLNVMRYVNNRPQMIQTAAGRVLRGLTWLESGMKVFEIQGERQRQATMLNNIGKVYANLGESSSALTYYEQALSLMRELRDKGGEAITLSNIGLAHSDLGETHRALTYLEQALDINREEMDKGGEAITLNNIGLMYCALGKTRGALNFYKKALTIHREMEDSTGMASTLNNIGGVYSIQGRQRRALEYFEKVMPILRELGNKAGIANVLNNIAGVHEVLGNMHLALTKYEQALDVLHDVGDKRLEATISYNTAMIHRRKGDLHKAIEYLTRCVELEGEIQHPDLEIDSHTLELLKRERDSGIPSGASTFLPNPLQLAGIIAAVMTQAADQREEWRSNLQEIRKNFASRGDNWLVDVAFADALLAILNQESPELPEDNPHADVIQKVNWFIAEYKKDNPS